MIAMTATVAALEEILVRKGDTFIRRLISRYRYPRRQLLTVISIGMICAACGGDAPPEGQVGHISENFGGVVSDEPRSALVGRDILSAGGNAVDAAVATYFALAVTYPGAATIGGGGICVVYSGASETVDAIDFRPALYSQGNKAAMIPGAVRGMFALHARYGRLQWGALLLAAERMARFGNTVSRAFARQIGSLPAAAFADRGVGAIFAPEGKPVNEGALVRQLELSTLLASIRLRGPGDFYAGDLAKSLAAGLGRSAGIDVPVSAFRSYKPKWLKTEVVDVGKDELHLPEGSIGSKAAEVWRAVVDKRSPAKEDASASFDSAGFITTDLSGGAVSCVVSANGTLGAARMIGNSGIIAAAPPREDAFPGVPMVLVNRPLRDARGAVSGSGGSAGTLRAIRAAANAFDDDMSASRALGPAPKPGPRVSIGRANLISCPRGARENPELCSFAADPGGSGLAVSAAF